MYFSYKIALQSVTVTQDTDGYPTKSSTSRTIWADVKTATRSEFYSAAAAGIEVAILFVVRSEDYQNERSVLYQGKEYNVVRTYQKDYGLIELTCSDKAA
ncbi:MAG: phage head closure protein [Angelakisella sp.]